MLQLSIDGHNQTLIPLPVFCTQKGLPPEFQVAYFEPKDWQGLGRLNASGRALAMVKRRVVAAVPKTIPLASLLYQVETLATFFHQELVAINPQIGLREVEIEFAVAGFADVLRKVAYQLIYLSHTYRHDPVQVQGQFDFPVIYQTWLDESTRVSATTHIYFHQGSEYRVQVIYNAYGRVGLKVEVAGEIYYVADTSLACPATSYMLSLCADVAQALCIKCDT